MLRSLLIGLLLFCAKPGFAQQESLRRRIDIEQVEILGQRPMKEIGVQRTILDTVVLRTTISASLADALTAGSTVFIKSYGRATLATASFRGTAPSHTQVTWNGMRVNSPMLGQVDFSLIPSFLIDDAAVYHGASSVGVSGGGLGGAVTLANKAPTEEGFSLRYVQGIGSYTTFDEFLHLTYRTAQWSSSTRILCSTSSNDFRYRNYNTKRLVTDENGTIIGRYHPLERNRNGAYYDLHLMQELYHTTRNGDRFSLSVWQMLSERGIAMLTSDTKNKRSSQDENTLRAVAGWERLRRGLKIEARGGYTYTDLRYLQKAQTDLATVSDVMVDARTYLHTLFAKAETEYAVRERWLFTASLSAHQHLLRSGDLSVINNQGVRSDTLYRQQRFELSAFASAKWRPVPRLGIAANVRWELYGNRTTPIIPALFIDYLLSRRSGWVIKASAARNYRTPTLNDLYFRPGGNPSLNPEVGWSYDLGTECALKSGRHALQSSLTWFDSYIDDWILWIRDGAKADIYTPMNIKRVHSYGLEYKLTATSRLGGDWQLLLDAHAAWTRSINQGDKFSPADRSVGKQLVYIPVWSGALNASATWRQWTLAYKWTWYSKRFTMTDNDKGVLGTVKPYFMSDLSLERRAECRRASFSLKACVNNLLNEEYETVSSHPMPRMNFSFYLGITPKFRRR